MRPFARTFAKTFTRTFAKTFAATCLLLVAAGACHSPAAAACNPAPIGEGQVASVTNATTLRLADGRDVRLAGIVPASALHPIGAAADAAAHAGTALLGNSLNGRDVALRGKSPKPDRYGRLVAFVYANGAAEPVQVALLEQGLAAAEPDVTECAGDLLDAEAAARRGKRGFWAEATAIKNAETLGDISPWMGRFVVAEGKITSVREARGTIYVNFGRRWTRDLAVTIPRRMIRSFEASGLVVKALAGRTVRVRGFLQARGGPRIEALGPGQIEVLVGK